jgi:RNA polymerase sigma-70 factor (ECF subfamily)
LAAGRIGSTKAEAALARLCQTYWYPLYVFVRRQGRTPDDCQDLVQGFFAKVLEKNYFRAACPEKGRFRSFLLTAFKRFIANEQDYAHRKKRGGDQQVFSLDAQDTEARFQSEPTDGTTPESAFERHWAITLLQQVFEQLETEFVAEGKAKLWEELKPFVTGEKHGNSYADVSRRLELSEGATRVAVHRLRHRYRDLLRQEIADTVDSPEAVDDEIRHLFASLA